MNSGSIADALITQGWIQGKEWDDDGQVCLDGAILVAAGLTLSHDYDAGIEHIETRHKLKVARDVVESVIAEEGILYLGVVGWNDCRGRTFDEVLRVAKRADEIIDYLKGLD